MSDVKKHIFRYRKLDIYKTQPLGRGSYGAVYKAKCDQLPCAAKILHDELVNSQDSGVDKYIKMFERECEFLSGFRHPHIVQYLGTAKCPERSKLPILMMELLDENLTKMLEKAKHHPLPYYLEVDLCHDIALAVSYLHSNDILHRDLSSNNVLVTAGKRAKVTDFGMSKLISSNTAATSLTICPGAPLYMPPEARKEPAEYTEKLDCYSEGVIMIQICSRETPREGERENHIKKICSTHPLLPIARKCLHENQYERPSAEELCQRLEILQEGVEYKLSILPNNVDSKDINELERQNKVLQKQLDQQEQQIKEHMDIIEDIKQTNSSLERQVSDLLGGNQTSRSLKQRWTPGRNLPKEMVRGDVAVDGDVAYFMNKDGTLYKYDSTLDPQEAWHQLVKCPQEHSCLAVIDGLLTAIGGLEFRGLGNSVTNKLISLKGGEIKTWETHFPNMPTKRYHAAATTTSKHLIVIGGISRGGVTGGLGAVNKVDVLNFQAAPLTWCEVAGLSIPFCKMSATTCGSQLYVMGGDNKTGVKTVLACSLAALVESKKNTSPTSVWRQLTDVPQYYATCASSNGELFAVGGTSDTRNPKAKTEVYRYNQKEGSWNIYTTMITPRYNSLVAVFTSKNLMVVVGGYDHNMSCDITELCQM